MMSSRDRTRKSGGENSPHESKGDKFDPRRAAADSIYTAIIAAQRIAGDGPLCEALEKLAGETGQNVLRYAAQVLNGKTLGRRPIDDREALRRIAAFSPDRRRYAVGMVARQMPGGDDAKVRAKNERRLRRKVHEKAVK